LRKPRGELAAHFLVVRNRQSLLGHGLQRGLNPQQRAQPGRQMRRARLKLQQRLFEVALDAQDGFTYRRSIGRILLG